MAEEWQSKAVPSRHCSVRLRKVCKGQLIRRLQLSPAPKAISRFFRRAYFSEACIFLKISSQPHCGSHKFLSATESLAFAQQLTWKQNLSESLFQCACLQCESVRAPPLCPLPGTVVSQMWELLMSSKVNRERNNFICKYPQLRSC